MSSRHSMLSCEQPFTRSQGLAMYRKALVGLLAAILIVLVVIAGVLVSSQQRAWDEAHPSATIDYTQVSISLNNYYGTQTAEAAE